MSLKPLVRNSKVCAVKDIANMLLIQCQNLWVDQNNIKRIPIFWTFDNIYVVKMLCWGNGRLTTKILGKKHFWHLWYNETLTSNWLSFAILGVSFTLCSICRSPSRIARHRQSKCQRQPYRQSRRTNLSSRLLLLCMHSRLSGADEDVELTINGYKLYEKARSLKQKRG